jgi:hypothetical protein
MIPAGFNASISFSSTKSKFGLLCLPDGTTRFDLQNLNKFYEVALQQGVHWYEHINSSGGPFGRMAVNGPLYLVTGCDKSASWGVASQTSASMDCEFSLEATACAIAEGELTVSYSWNRRGPVSVRVSRRLEMDGRVKRQNNSPFIRGFKISVREGALSKLKSPIKLSLMDRNRPNKFIGSRSSHIPGFELGSSFIVARSGVEDGSGHSQESPSNGQQSHSSSSDEEDSSVEAFLERSQVMSVKYYIYVCLSLLYE